MAELTKIAAVAGVVIALTSGLARAQAPPPLSYCANQLIERELGTKWEPEGPLCVPPVGSKPHPAELAPLEERRAWGVPDPPNRPTGAVYNTPEGLMVWLGKGWAPWQPANIKPVEKR